MNKKKKKNPHQELVLDLDFGSNSSTVESAQQTGFVDVESLIADNTQNPEEFATSERYKKLSGRREQLNLKVTAEFKRAIKAAALRRNMMIVEIIEEAWQLAQLKQQRDKL